ncbi:MAG: polysaccharide deacetylase family protein, partial [Anaerolineae bacterium]|nr:polysaccharide deacetylase family protein [Anaerolineae bacterium]
MTVTITSSWDDGHVLDLRVADMLDRYGLTGTFYIARDFLDERMSDSQLQDLAQRHEVGAHTLTHPVLTEISLEQARDEIHGSKIWLEDVLGQEV